MHACNSDKESAMFTRCLAVAAVVMVVTACGPTEIPVTREVPVEVTRIVEQTVIVPQEVEVTKVVVATPTALPTCYDAIRLYDQFKDDVFAEYAHQDSLTETQETEIYDMARGIAYSIGFLFPDCVEVVLDP